MVPQLILQEKISNKRNWKKKKNILSRQPDTLVRYVIRRGAVTHCHPEDTHSHDDCQRPKPPKSKRIGTRRRIVNDINDYVFNLRPSLVQCLPRLLVCLYCQHRTENSLYKRQMNRRVQISNSIGQVPFKMNPILAWCILVYPLSISKRSSNVSSD
jgi:hypothetical protein